MQYYYEASLAGLRLESKTDAGIVEAQSLSHARTMAEGEALTNFPTAVILRLEVRPVKESELCDWD
jgi:hypothetical protein